MRRFWREMTTGDKGFEQLKGRPALDVVSVFDARPNARWYSSGTN